MEQRCDTAVVWKSPNCSFGSYFYSILFILAWIQSLYDSFWAGEFPWPRGPWNQFKTDRISSKNTWLTIWKFVKFFLYSLQVYFLDIWDFSPAVSISNCSQEGIQLEQCIWALLTVDSGLLCFNREETENIQCNSLFCLSLLRMADNDRQFPLFDWHKITTHRSSGGSKPWERIWRIGKCPRISIITPRIIKKMAIKKTKNKLTINNQLGSSKIKVLIQWHKVPSRTPRPQRH